MPLWAWILIGFLVLVVAVTAAIWIKMSYGSFPNKIMPGAEYKVGDRTYQAPNLPHKTYGLNDAPSLERAIPMLEEQVLIDLRALAINSFEVLQENGIEFWCTGGTLISAELWGHFMPYDDDIDCATSFKNAPYLYGKDFARKLDERGLESFFLRGCSDVSATKEGAAVRIRKKGTEFPTMDLFFVDEMEDGSYARVKTWSNSGKTRTWALPSEHWEQKEWLYPIRTKHLDGMDWPVGNQPAKMLDQQYGKTWSDYIQSPRPLFKTHAFAFWISNAVNAWYSHDLKE